MVTRASSWSEGRGGLVGHRCRERLVVIDVVIPEIGASPVVAPEVVERRLLAQEILVLLEFPRPRCLRFVPENALRQGGR